MNEPLRQLAIFVRDLLSVDESNIFIGRSNFRLEDFTGQQIVVDAITGGTRIAVSEEYDADTEVMTYIQRFDMPCIIDFFGDTAWADVTKFSTLIQSQAGYELQRDSGVTIYNVSSITDIKLLTGEQYSNRFEIEMMIGFNISTEVDTLRIDEAQLDDFLWEE